MNLYSKVLLILLLSAFLVNSSCRRDEDFSEIPEIEYKGMVKIFNPTLELYDRGVLSITFKDGDGDIGLASSDTFPPFDPGSRYYYNLIITYFELQNGKEVEVPLLSWNPDTQEYDTLSLSARVPVLTPAGKNKAIKGEIQDTIFIYNFNSTFDTIRFDVVLVDRALHESNTVSTPWFLRE
jgi:hypothetical protein